MECSRTLVTYSIYTLILLYSRSWDIVVDTCAICRNHIMDLCIECQANQVCITNSFSSLYYFRQLPITKIAMSRGESATTLSTSTAFPDGFVPVTFARSIIESGNFNVMDIDSHYLCLYTERR
jgi:hypothetical protein